MVVAKWPRDKTPHWSSLALPEFTGKVLGYAGCYKQLRGALGKMASSVENSESPLRILLIDDDEVDRLAVKRALATGGLESELQEATNFAAAAKALTSGAFDCALLDFHLPGGTGLELIQLAKASRVDAPIVVLTGQGDETLAVELMKAGAADYVPKKLLTSHRLMQSIRQALRLHDAERFAQAAHAALATQAAQLKLLADSSLGLHAAVTFEKTLELAAEMGCKLGGARMCVARLTKNPSGGTLERRCVMSGEAPFSQEETARWESLIWQSTQEVRLTAIEIDALSEWQSSGRLNGLMGTPILGHDRKPIGSIMVVDRSGGEFEAIDSLMLTQLAKATAVSLENSRLYAEAQHAVRAREDVLAVVSHDLRNPLSVVSMSASMLKQSLGDGPGSAQVGRIQRAVGGMNRLIEDLLDVASLDAGTLAVHPTQVVAANLLTDAVDTTASIAAEQGCKVIAAETDTSLTVHADSERIAQLLGNIIGNALKFVPQGTGEVRLQISKDGSRICFSVTDNGVGIAPEHLPHVFSRHYRASNSRPGRGLGLYIARGIVDAHKGEIGIESSLGQGTTVRFWLAPAPASLQPV